MLPRLPSLTVEESLALATTVASPRLRLVDLRRGIAFRAAISCTRASCASSERSRATARRGINVVESGGFCRGFCLRPDFGNLDRAVQVLSARCGVARHAKLARGSGKTASGLPLLIYRQPVQQLTIWLQRGGPIRQLKRTCGADALPRGAKFDRSPPCGHRFHRRPAARRWMEYWDRRAAIGVSKPLPHLRHQLKMEQAEPRARLPPMEPISGLDTILWGPAYDL